MDGGSPLAPVSFPRARGVSPPRARALKAARDRDEPSSNQQQGFGAFGLASYFLRAASSDDHAIP